MQNAHHKIVNMFVSTILIMKNLNLFDAFSSTLPCGSFWNQARNTEDLTRGPIKA